MGLTYWGTLLPIAECHPITTIDFSSIRGTFSKNSKDRLISLTVSIVMPVVKILGYLVADKGLGDSEFSNEYVFLYFRIIWFHYLESMGMPFMICLIKWSPLLQIIIKLSVSAPWQIVFSSVLPHIIGDSVVNFSYLFYTDLFSLSHFLAFSC